MQKTGSPTANSGASKIPAAFWDIEVTRRRILIAIIAEAVAGQHMPAYPQVVMAVTVVAYEHVCSDIPTRFLWKSYVTSMRMERHRIWSQTDLWLGWEKYQQTDEFRRIKDEEAHRTMEGGARSQCQRCFGTGMEFIPGKGVRPGCKHAPLSVAERRQFKEAGLHTG